MPVDKPQHTTLPPTAPTTESAPTHEIVQQGFHQHLRAHIRAAVQVVMEEIMREELTQFVGAQWGESSPARKGYRNGSYTRESFDRRWSDPGAASAPRPGRKVPHPTL